MPAGVSWPTYLKFFTAAMLSMFAGAQLVHIYYRPLDDLDQYLEREKLMREQHAFEEAGSTPSTESSKIK